MFTRKASLAIFGVAALGLIGISGLIIHRLTRDREARHRNNLGVALIDERKFPEAIAELEAALQLSSRSAATRFNLGLARYHAGDLQGAREALLEVRLGDPDHVRARYVLGLVDQQGGFWKEASEQFRWVAEKDPGDVHAHLNLGKCLLQLGDHAAAAEALRKAIALSPSNPEARHHLLRTLLALGDKDGAAAERSTIDRLEKAGAFIMDSKARQHVVRDEHAQPLPDSSPSREVAEAAPRYANITLEVGLDFRHAGTRDPGIERALASQPLPRSWFEDPGNRSRLARAASASCAFLESDNDGKLDLLFLNVDGKHALLRQTADGKVTDATAVAGLGPAPEVGTACACGDYDNDGWTDIFIAGIGGARLYRNAAGKLEDVTEASGIAGALPAGSWCASAAFADVDHDADLDIYVARLIDIDRPAGKPDLRFPDDFEAQSNLLFRNNRDGTFSEIGSQAHAGEKTGGARSVLFSDVDEDGAVDCVAFGWRGDGSVYLNRRDGTFTRAQGIVPPAITLSPPGEARAHGDYDGDGAPDLLFSRSGAAGALFRNIALPRNWLTVRLAGETAAGSVKSNRKGIGSQVEVRSPRMWGRKEVRAGNGLGGCDAPEVYFDLGEEENLDYARASFPSGSKAAEREVKSNRVVTLKEPALGNNSCPAVFAWNGASFDFITDTISAGILGELVAPGRYWEPDPDEWIRIEGARLQALGGNLDLRWVNPLEEVTYLDGVRLVAVDHAESLEVYPAERMVGEPSNRSPAKLYLLEGLRPPAGARDDRGGDAAEALLRIDRASFDRFRLLPFDGFAEDWGLEIDLGATPGKVLLLHGWTHWNSSASVLAAAQARRELWGPVLDVKGTDGAWRPGLADLGVPAGLPRTMLVDLAGCLKEGEHVVRVRTNRMVYFDQALVADTIAVLDLDAPSATAIARLTEIRLSRADLRRLGYPRRVLPDGKRPEVLDYSAIEPHAEWRTHGGFLTRFGDVTQLLTAVDDRFTVMSHGEEVALSFDAAGLPELPSGWKRTYLLYSNGYEKGIDLNAPTPFAVEPLPFQAMGAYPPAVGAEGAGGADVERLGYLLEWNTRFSPGWR